MQTEIKKRDINNYLLIVYPENAPSVGYSFSKDELYDLHIKISEELKRIDAK